MICFLDSQQATKQQQMSSSSNSNQSQFLSLISSADISSYYGIAIASAVVAGSVLYYYANKSGLDSSKNSSIRSRRAPIVDFNNQTIVVSVTFCLQTFIILIKKKKTIHAQI